jgi:hypothetical protein
MHIAINGYFWNRSNSGSGQYTRNLVTTLAKLVSDLQISLIVPLAPGEVLPPDIPPTVNCVPVPVRAGNWGKLLFEQHAFPKACRTVKADLAHVPYWGAPLRSPVPLVVTVHDLTTMLVPEYRRKNSAKFYNALVSAAVGQLRGGLTYTKS